jgi:hypothetical protein
MSERRNIFIHGLSLTLRRFPALLWTYVFNLGLALIFSIGFHNKFASILDHSLVSQRLIGGFDLGTALDALFHISDASGESATAGSYFGIPLYLLLYFFLVPGALFCYQTNAPARLSTLLHQGLIHFWRFVRITILMLLVAGVILGLLSFLQNKWAEHVDGHSVGRNAFLATFAGYVIVFLVASVLRLYFDLVEVYTVQLGQHLRRNGKPDRRVRRTLGPAWRTLRANFAEAWPIFLFLALLGAAAVVLTARISMHMLAQPRVWPTFLLAQFGLFVLLLTRFWQRGVETSLALQYPIIVPSPLPILPIVGRVSPIDPLHPHHSITPVPAAEFPRETVVESGPDQLVVPANEPISNPEPAPPSLDEPDLGVFHREPKPPQ